MIKREFVITVVTSVAMVTAVSLGAIVTFYCLQQKRHFHGKVKSSMMAEMYQNGAVVTDNVRCAEIGRDILKKGGSAVDAAISTSFCLGTYSMHSAGIGGGGVMLVYKRDKQTMESFDYREVAPRLTNPDIFFTNKKPSFYGGLVIAVPGEVKGLYAAHQKYGKLKWKDLIQPTIDLCENGFRMTLRLHQTATFPLSCLREKAVLSDILFKNGSLVDLGDMLYNKRLANTLRRIAENPHTFYNGSLAEEIVKDIQNVGGIITLEDLKHYEIRKREFVTTEHSNMKLYTTTVPTGGPILVHILNILKGYNFQPRDLKDGNRSVLTYHRMLEAIKFGYAQKANIGDPAFIEKEYVQKWLENMTSKVYGNTVRQKIKDDSIQDFEAYGHGLEPTDHGTSQISVYAPNGDAVSMTTTIGMWYGSQVMSPKTGILFNNQITDFIISKSIQANQMNTPQPNKTPQTSMAPVILTDKDGNVKIVLGSSGGKVIITAILQGLLYMTSFGYRLGEAITRPRLQPSENRIGISVEPARSLPEYILEGLRKLGHQIDKDVIVYLTALQGIYIEDKGRILGKSDPRTYSYSAGY